MKRKFVCLLSLLSLACSTGHKGQLQNFSVFEKGDMFAEAIGENVAMYPHTGVGDTGLQYVLHVLDSTLTEDSLSEGMKLLQRMLSACIVYDSVKPYSLLQVSYLLPNGKDYSATLDIDPADYEGYYTLEVKTRMLRPIDRLTAFLTIGAPFNGPAGFEIPDDHHSIVITYKRDSLPPNQHRWRNRIAKIHPFIDHFILAENFKEFQLDADSIEYRLMSATDSTKYYTTTLKCHPQHLKGKRQVAF